MFTDDLIDGYMALRWEEVTQVQMTPHPAEFVMYYSV